MGISKAVKAEQAEALEQLRAMINPGATIFTTVRRVARSGMSRTIDAYLLLHDDKVWLSGLIARAGLFTLDRKSEALKVQGCGMDLGFHVVYETAHVSPADIAFNDNPAHTVFAADLRRRFNLIYCGHLSERHVRSLRR